MCFDTRVFVVLLRRCSPGTLHCVPVVSAHLAQAAGAAGTPLNPISYGKSRAHLKHIASRTR